jgi:hypothetical protein
MKKAKEDFLADAPESARIVFARGGWSELVTEDHQPDTPGSAQYGGRALPTLLREQWAIRSTIPSGDGTYFVLGRAPVGAVDMEDPPSSRAMGLS